MVDALGLSFRRPRMDPTRRRLFFKITQVDKTNPDFSQSRSEEHGDDMTEREANRTNV